MKWKDLAKTAVSLPVGLFVAGAVIAINELGFQRSTAAATEIAQVLEIQGSVNLLLQQVLDAETGQRGYLLTGDERYLEPYNLASADIQRSLDGLRALYKTQPEPLAQFGILSTNVSRKLTELDLTLQLRRKGNTEAAQFITTTDVGKQHMDAIRAQASKLLDFNADRIERAQAQIDNALLLARVQISLVALGALLAFYFYLRQTAALALSGLREQESLKKERDMLDEQVRERTASLAELATHLQMVREQEREYLARELHDELGALLTAAKLDVARLKSRLAPEAHEAFERLKHLTETLNHGIALKRRIIENLRPSALTNLGLIEALEILAREFAEASGLDVVTDLEAVDIDDAKQLSIYRLVQESLTNIGKYAQAKKIIISLHNLASHIEVQVQDDGLGFDPGQQRTANHGLAGMRHRIEASRGQFKVESAPGQGTRIAALIPSASA
ncbi:MAG: CHASE3 domain-containing protein [Burkholderiaceae bacterium]